MVEISSVAERCTRNNQVIPNPITDSSGNTNVKWSEYLSQFFLTIPNLLTYHQFSVRQDKPGVVVVKGYSDSTPKDVSILRLGMSISSFPCELKPKELDLKRQWYLYESIRPHCNSNLACDITCPKPKDPKPSTTTPSVETSTKRPCPDDTGTKKKGKRTCSICKLSGHTKRTCTKK